MWNVTIGLAYKNEQVTKSKEVSGRVVRGALVN